MGCDIHIRTETYNQEKKEWISADSYYIDPCNNKYILKNIYKGRNYELFGILAGVRRKSELSLSPKGIPSDCCEEIKKNLKYWEGDSHTYSYLTLSELVCHLDELNLLYKNNEIHEDAISCFKEFVDYLKTYYQHLPYSVKPDSPNEFRIVFWFDN